MMNTIRPVFTDDQILSGRALTAFRFIDKAASTLEADGLKHDFDGRCLFLAQDGYTPFRSLVPDEQNPDIPLLSDGNGALVVMLFLLASRHDHLTMVDRKGYRIVPSVSSINPWRGNMTAEKLLEAAILCGFMLSLSADLPTISVGISVDN